MSRVLTNNTSLSYAIEESLGVLPTTPTWRLVEPNSYGAYGATITTVARDPISQNRQRRKGTVTDLDSAVDFEADMTLSNFVDFAEGFVFAKARNKELNFEGDAVEATGYTIDALSSDIASRVQYNSAGAVTLFFGAGYSTEINNGLKVINGPVSTGAELIPVAGLTVEATPPTNATLQLAGIRSTTSDIRLTLTATGAILSSEGGTTGVNFPALGLTAGQFIHIGGTVSGSQLAVGNFGYARVMQILADSLVLDKLDPTLSTTISTSPNNVAILFGTFIRNVPTNSPDFLEQSVQFELTYPNLDNPTGDRYEYALGNFSNTMAVNLPLSDKSTISFGFIGTDSAPPTDIRKANAGAPVFPSQTGAFNTTSDCTRLRITEIDETGMYTDFKSATLTFSNNVSPEKVLCTLGARFMNFGNYEVNIDSQLIFSDYRIASAIRDNRTMSMDFGLKNDDGAVMFDIPSMTIGGGDREFPVNETVLINTTIQAFQDADLGTSIGISLFPAVP